MKTSGGNELEKVLVRPKTAPSLLSQMQICHSQPLNNEVDNNNNKTFYHWHHWILTGFGP